MDSNIRDEFLMAIHTVENCMSLLEILHGSIENKHTLNALEELRYASEDLQKVIEP
jgi:hypothetical protein